MKLIKVKAGEGLTMHFPQRVVAAPGAKTLQISGETVVEVNGDDRFIRRRLKVGDLVLVKSAKVDKPKTRKPKED